MWEQYSGDGPKFEHLPPSAKKDILNAWNDLRSSLAAFATQLRSEATAAAAFVDVTQSQEAQPSSDLSSAVTTLSEVEDGLLSLQNSVQRNIMALPALFEKKETLTKAIEDPILRDLGFAPPLSRRLKTCFNSQRAIPDDEGIITEPVVARPKSFQSLFQVGDGHDVALLEYKGGEDLHSLKPGDLERREERVQTLAELLKTRGPLEFNTLQCIRWFRQPDTAKFGLVFEYPTGYDKFMSLREIIATIGVSQRPTLGQRFRIAKYIGEALSRWHTSANWVHQAVASHNIFFFKPVKCDRFDYSNPVSCGFDFARPDAGSSDATYVDDFESNIYRHPSRRGVPSEHHTKYHDLYSYGVILLEIGT